MPRYVSGIAIFNLTKTDVDNVEEEIEPMIPDRRLCDRRAHRDKGEDPIFGPRGVVAAWVFSQLHIGNQSYIPWASLESVAVLDQVTVGTYVSGS